MHIEWYLIALLLGIIIGMTMHISLSRPTIQHL